MFDGPLSFPAFGPLSVPSAAVTKYRYTPLFLMLKSVHVVDGVVQVIGAVVEHVDESVCTNTGRLVGESGNFVISVLNT